MSMSHTSQLDRTQVHLVIIFAAALLLVLPIFFFGIPRGNDLPQHIQFAVTYDHSIRSGELMPVWSPLTNDGYGDVGTRFYPPLTYYVLFIFAFVSGGLFNGTVLAVFFWTFLSGCGAYFLAREFTPHRYAVLAGLIYMVMPYHLNEIYNASLYAEYSAAAILPFCFLFVYRICRERGWGGVFALALAYGLLILTHLPTALMASAMLAIAGIIWVRENLC